MILTDNILFRIVRQQRNLAEKQRRDKLNGYINELANLVPMVSMATKRLDKTSVLRLSAAYLRLSQSNFRQSENLKLSPFLLSVSITT